jgi:hypothetical protein
MAQRPSLDMSKLSTADKILLGGGLLFLIGSFLPWQRICSAGIQDRPGECTSFSMWSGDASILGVLAGLMAIILLVAGGLTLAGVALPVTVPPSAVLSGLALGTAGVALLKFLFIVGSDAGYGAFIGFILTVAIAYGGWMKMQEAKILPPPTAGGGTEPGPYNP